ncbi:MAG: hypothetical protein QOJ29_2441, partial [Thermoleophilaceae bacterium]|nr:hypothetical protein [Thermoleophilaceae bacterium]
MTSRLIIQRAIPHYRVPLFERLYEEFGWVVATAEKSDDQEGLLVTGEDRPWVRRFPARKGSRSTYDVALPLDRICRELQPDVIVSEYSLQMKTSWQLARMARKGGRPKLVFWSQGWNHERGFIRPDDAASQLARLHLLRAADAHLCYSREGADYLKQFMPRGAGIFVAANTVDVGAVQPRQRGRNRAGSPPTLLFVGRLTHDKRVPLLIKAASLARRSVPDLRLIIVGEGPDLPAVRTAAEREGSWIQLTGAVYDQERLAGLYAEASLMVYAGSIGLAANEALAHRLPVMIFDRPTRGAYHHPEHAYVIDGVTGYRVQGQSAGDLAAAIVGAVTAVEQPKAHLSAGIDAFVGEELSLDRMVEGFRELSAWLEAQTPSKAKAVFVWDNFGPMHDDRCAAVAGALGGANEVLGVELFSTSDTYSWRSAPAAGFAKQTLFAGADRHRIWSITLAGALIRAAGRSGASTIFLCHYERFGIFLAAIALRLRGRRVLTMGDMKYDDKKRASWWEALKRMAMLPYQGALAASTRTADYMRSLGLPP